MKTVFLSSSSNLPYEYVQDLHKIEKPWVRFTTFAICCKLKVFLNNAEAISLWPLPGACQLLLMNTDRVRPASEPGFFQ